VGKWTRLGVRTRTRGTDPRSRHAKKGTKCELFKEKDEGPLLSDRFKDYLYDEGRVKTEQLSDDWGGEQDQPWDNGANQEKNTYVLKGGNERSLLGNQVVVAGDRSWDRVGALGAGGDGTLGRELKARVLERKGIKDDKVTWWGVQTSDREKGSTRGAVGSK